MATIASLKRLPAVTLSALLLDQAADKDPSIAVIDVRDNDHIGGHIRGSHHIPSSTLDHAMPSLVRRLATTKTIVFHCALSQQRGPRAALLYLRERERLIGSATVGTAMKKSAAAADKKTAAAEEGAADADWEDVDAVTRDGCEARVVEQMVYVLDRGFQGWQEVYGEDERLTENYNKALWQDY